MNPLKYVPKPKFPLYSSVDKAIDDIVKRQPKATGDQYLAMLRKTGGVKKAELEERGIKEALKSKPKLTADELLEIRRKHPAPKVEDDVRYSDISPSQNLKLEELVDTVIERRIRDLEEDPEISDREFEVLANRISRDRDGVRERILRENPEDYSGDAEYAEYQIPGGKNYREILLKLPNNAGTYEPPHFGGEKNLLAHARVSDRVGPNGEKILHIEEIQSDWHQAGRDEGYRAVGDERVAAKATPKNGYWEVTDQNGKFMTNVLNDDFPDTPSEAAALGVANSRLTSNQSWQVAADKRVPDAPFKDNWHELVMKRLIDDAAKNGYDRVILTPGRQQVERYEDQYRRAVDDIFFSDNGSWAQLEGRRNGEQVFQKELVRDAEGKWVLEEDDPSKRHSLEKMIGKKLASDIYNSSEKMHTFSGNDLTIGGEGMKFFYDERLPYYLNDFGKKYGVRVNEIRMPAPPRDSWEVAKLNRGQDYVNGQATWDDVLKANPPEEIERFSLPFHSFEITPQMREDITSKGLPLYQAAPIGAGLAMDQADTEKESDQLIRFPEEAAPMKRGGKVRVSMDAMRIATMNKSKGKRHG